VSSRLRSRIWVVVWEWWEATHGITKFGMPQASKVCKDLPKRETDLFKDCTRHSMRVRSEERRESVAAKPISVIVGEPGAIAG
jgi:hypothetical protein